MSAEVQDHFYTSADGLSLYYREYAGRSPFTVVCLPGLTRNSRDFAALAGRLAPRYRVLAPDLRGRGRSAYDATWQNYHPGTYVADVLALLKAAQVTRVALVGTSLGGLLAMILGATQRPLVAGIVLNDIGPVVDPEGLARISRYVGLAPPVGSWKEAVAQVRSTYGAALPTFTDADWERYARQSFHEDARGIPVLDMDPMIGEAVRSAAGTGPAPDLWPMWAALAGIPVLAIRGETSDILSAATLERMAREHPGMQSLTVAQRGHAPTLDEPEAAAAVEAFLASLAG